MMNLRYTLPATALGLALTSPAFAISAIAHVPSLWPAEGAFETSDASSMIATKGSGDITSQANENSKER